LIQELEGEKIFEFYSNWENETFNLVKK